MTLNVLDREQITLYCPQNDLEAVSIIAIAERLSIDVIKGPNKWGVTLDDAIDKLMNASLKANLIVIEMPGAQATNTLQERGINVIHIDHHIYSKHGDLSHIQSSIEQFASLIGYTLSYDEQLIAINDRDFIPGLAAHGCSYQKMLEIRELEAHVRGVETERKDAIQWLNAQPLRTEHFSFFEVPERFVQVFAEVAQLPSENDYLLSQSTNTSLILPNIFVVYGSSDDPTQIEVCCSATYAFFFKALSQRPYNAVTTWFGGGDSHKFFGARPNSDNAKPELISLLTKIRHYIGELNNEHR
ncbi:hypothetical protein [Paraglaciecola sp. 20A4]|uniref:hypothetical protein n=1 Tax=Paraglaciecola sp. 20A4 TaxID=2687288 RepID=UPI0014096511|nr:hypothetical protein [Paraglaciecola sp. 20A4]